MSDEGKYNEFRTKVGKLLKELEMGNNSNTPHHVLSNYLTRQLINFDKSVNDRNEWFRTPVNPKDIWESPNDPK